MELVAEVEEPIGNNEFKIILGKIQAKQSADKDDNDETIIVFQLIEGQV